MSNVILVFMFGSLILLFAIGIVFYQKCIRILKSKHTEVWNSLGSPSLILNNSISTQKLFLAFIKDKRYLQTENQDLIRVATFLRYYNKIYFVYFVIVLVSFIVLILSSG